MRTKKKIETPLRLIHESTLEPWGVYLYKHVNKKKKLVLFSWVAFPSEINLVCENFVFYSFTLHPSPFLFYRVIHNVSFGVGFGVDFGVNNKS